MNFIKNNANKIIGSVLIALLAAAVAGDYIFLQKIGELNAGLKKRNDEIKDLKKTLTGTTTETESWKKKYDDSIAQCKTDTDNLQAKITAFAKQAAACEQIKHKLHIK